MNYDVIIVGAGFAGAGLAWMLAEKGHHILLLERQERHQLGKTHARIMLDVDTFSKTGLSRPQGDELLALLDTFYAYSPSGKIRKSIDFSALLLDGHRFQQRLLNEAEAAGAKIERRSVRGALLDGDTVIGVETESHEEFYAPLVVDASGNQRILLSELVRHGLLHDLQSEHLESEYGVAYRLSGTTAATPLSELHIYFSVQGGYIWRSAFDIGLGKMSQAEANLETVRAEVKALTDKFGWKMQATQQEDIGQIPIRHPLLNLVANGFAVVGDASFMVNSVRGGGISAGLKGARILADIAHHALLAEDLRSEQLWTYNEEYQRKIGCQLAYQDVMRQALMNESPENMEFAFEKDVITADDIRSSLSGRLLEISTLQKVQKGLRGAANPGLLMRLNHKLDWGRHLYAHFRKYPATPSYFPAWREELKHIQEKISA